MIPEIQTVGLCELIFDDLTRSRLENKSSVITHLCFLAGRCDLSPIQARRCRECDDLSVLFSVRNKRSSFKIDASRSARPTCIQAVTSSLPHPLLPDSVSKHWGSHSANRSRASTASTVCRLPAIISDISISIYLKHFLSSSSSSLSLAAMVIIAVSRVVSFFAVFARRSLRRTLGGAIG